MYVKDEAEFVCAKVLDVLAPCLIKRQTASESKSPSDAVEVPSPGMSHVTEICRFRGAAERELSA